jgi:hypothetical protein
LFKLNLKRKMAETKKLIVPSLALGSALLAQIPSEAST